MNYNEIDVKSEKYKKLSINEKKVTIDSQIEKLFVNNGKNILTVIYNGEKKFINKDKMGIFKDLCQRQKAINKQININNNNVNKSISNCLNKSIKDNDIVKPVLGGSIISGLNKIKSLCKKTNKSLSKKNKEHKITLTSIKKHSKRIKAGICALLIAVSGYAAMSRLNKESSNLSDKKNEYPSINEPNDYSPINVDYTKKEDNLVETEEVVEEQISDDVNKEDNFLSFDDTVTVNDNSYIYTNAYDASRTSNFYNPYYGGNYERDIQGIVYELDGNIYVIYKSDVNAIYKQKELILNGANVTAVLVTRSDLLYTQQYEGYYNVNSVKVKTK